MLSNGNSKLGKIPNWSIPAIKTCPGRSKLCEDLCYATTGCYAFKSTQEAHIKNLRTSKGTTWVKRMVAEVKSKKAKVFRWHGAGDYYDAEYARKCIDIAKACPDKIFYSYTRSWRRADILPLLLELAALPNVQLWFSVDKETGEAPRHDLIKQAYLAVDDDDIPSFPVDLVFREKVKTVKKKIAGAMVCPVENGTENDVTCESCKYCYKEAKPLVQLSV